MTDSTDYALSASPLSHSDNPLGLALRLYDAFSAAVQRKCTCLVLRSLAGMGGLPLGLGFMVDILPTQKRFDKCRLSLYSVYTLNTEARMKKTIMDGWLEEKVMCGWAFPITRRQAMNEMMADGMSQADAVKALCWFKAVR